MGLYKNIVRLWGFSKIYFVECHGLYALELDLDIFNCGAFTVRTFECGVLEFDGVDMWGFRFAGDSLADFHLLRVGPYLAVGLYSW